MSAQLNSTQEEVTKIYKYNRNGKKLTVKRRYINKGENKAKKFGIQDYFDFDYKKSLNIKENYEIFNKVAEFPVSYSMFYKHYKNWNDVV